MTGSSVSLCLFTWLGSVGAADVGSQQKGSVPGATLRRVGCTLPAFVAIVKNNNFKLQKLLST